MLFELKSKGWSFELATLTQEKAEQFAEIVNLEHKSGLHRNSAVIRCALKAAWLMGDYDIPNLPPAQVTWMAQKLTDQYIEAITIPKE